MAANEVNNPEKRRVPRTSLITLICVILERYCTAGIGSPMKLTSRSYSNITLDNTNVSLIRHVFSSVTISFLNFISFSSAILYIFFNEKIGYDDDLTTAAYHSYEVLLHIFPVVGAIIADSWLGRYKTMIYTSVVFAVGCFLTAVGVVDVFNLPIKVFSSVGLVIMTFGDGCLVTLISTYGANQYKSIEVKSISLYFSLYYFMFNCGSIISRFVSPILREDLKCFGNDDCFPLVFGLPGILMVFVTILIVIASRFAETEQVEGTTMLNVLACIKHAIILKIKSRKDNNKLTIDHWLDYSKEKYGAVLVWETRLIMKVVVLYIPIILFWALFYQQGSRWVYQAIRMNGEVGSYIIKPDQFNVLNPLLVLILIPMFEYILYPPLAKIGIRTALQKATLGGVLGGVAFLISAIIELQIDGAYLHMVWLVPQYVVMTMAEILISIPLMNFSYSEAPESMKTILQAFFFVSVGLGNLIVVIVAGSKLIESQFYEFILFAGLMFIDIFIFWLLSRAYKSLKQAEDDVVGNEEDGS